MVDLLQYNVILLFHLTITTFQIVNCKSDWTYIKNQIKLVTISPCLIKLENSDKIGSDYCLHNNFGKCNTLSQEFECDCDNDINLKWNKITKCCENMCNHGQIMVKRESPQICTNNCTEFEAEFTSTIYECQDSNQNGKSKFGTWKIVGIVIGSILVGVVVLGTIIFVIVKYMAYRIEPAPNLPRR